MRKKAKILLVIAAAVLLALAGIRTVYRLFPLRHGEYAEKYANEYNLDKYMVLGVIYAESGFDNKAHSGIARGLMQLTDQTAESVAEELGLAYTYDMADDPETNIKMGCYYLSCLISKYHNEETALAAYNAGMGNVSKWLADSRYSADGEILSDIPYSETKNYVKRVKLFSKIYKKLYGKRGKTWKS